MIVHHCEVAAIRETHIAARRIHTSGISLEDSLSDEKSREAGKSLEGDAPDFQCSWSSSGFQASVLLVNLLRGVRLGFLQGGRTQNEDDV